MKKICYYIIIFIILCFLGDSLINYSIAKQINEQSPYCLSFASIGANLLESRLDSWAKIKPVKTFIEMDEELIRILLLLDLPVDKEKFQHLEHDGKKTLRYEFFQNNQYYLFSLQSDTKAAYFLQTSVSSKDDQKQRMEEKILKRTLHCKSYFQYKGSIATRLDFTGREKYTDVLLKCLQAKQIDQYEDDNLISTTAFSPKLKNQVETVKLADREYNIQIALRTNNNENKSIVYLGLPLLLNDY